MEGTAVNPLVQPLLEQGHPGAQGRGLCSVRDTPQPLHDLFQALASSSEKR